MSDPLPAIRAEGVRKWFRAGGKPRSVYQALAEALRGAGSEDALVALDGVSFAVARGEKLGIVGDNGSGKTTLLRTLAGLYRPNAGRLEVEGEVALVPGLGIGMLDELTVEDNIYLYGAINGMARSRIRTELPDILDWAELGAFRDARLKTLSSGMRSRLAFSAVRHVDAGIYLMDEVLSAGDRNFRQKCEAVFAGFKASGRTFVVAAHELEFIRGFCDRVLWLHRGQQMAWGAPEEVIERYVASRSVAAPV